MSKLMDYYQVAWTDAKGRTRYGVVNTSEEAHEEFKRGYLIVSDAIVPGSDVVELKKARKLKAEFQGEYDKYVEKALEEATRLSNSIDGLAPGKLFNIGVGDGYAWYVVTKVTPKNVTVEWRGFCMDRWTDQVLGWEGTFPRRAIEPLVKRADGLRKIFGH